jgi:hypothetical protein
MQITYIQKHIYAYTSIHYTNKAFVFFFFEYPHIRLKSETSPVRGSCMLLPTSTLSRNETYILILAGI